MLRIDCWEAEKDLKTTSGSDCALNALAIDDPLEYAKLYLDGNLQMWVDAEDSLDIFYFLNGGSENQSRRSKLSGFSFAVMRQIINSFYFELLLCYLMSAIGMNRQECKHK